MEKKLQERTVVLTRKYKGDKKNGRKKSINYK